MIKDCSLEQTLGILPDFANMYFVYELVCPSTLEVRYIGKTNNLTNRYYLHVSDAHLKATTHKNSWIKSLKAQNLKPIMRVICITKDLNSLNKLEINAIKEARLKGYRLTNMTDGGDGITKHSPDTIEKIKLAVKGRKRSPCSPETKEKISKAQKGRKRKPWSLDRLLKQAKAILAINLQNNETTEFVSAREAGRVLKVNPYTVISVCKKKPRYKTCKGFTFRYKD